MESDSDDGGLKYITRSRARPPTSRQANKTKRGAGSRFLTAYGSSSGSDNDSSDSDFNIKSFHTPIKTKNTTISASPCITPPVLTAQPKYQKNQTVYYKRPSDTQSYMAVVINIDLTINPPSYVVRFSDLSERTTEEHYLHENPQNNARPPPHEEEWEAGDDESEENAANDTIVSTTQTNNVEQSNPAVSNHSVNAYTGESEFLKGSVASNGSKADGKQKDRNKKEKKSKKEKKEKKKKKHEEEEEEEAAEVVVAAAGGEDGDGVNVTPKIENNGKQKAQQTPQTKHLQQQQTTPQSIKQNTPQPQAKASVRLTLPHLKQPHPLVSRIVPDTKVYGSFQLEKISNRGFRHKRIMVITSVYIVYAKEDGEIRKWFEIGSIEKVFVQELGGGSRKILLRLKEDQDDEPDVVLIVRDKVDPRNSHKSFAEILKVIQNIHLQRRQAMLKETTDKQIRSFPIEILASGEDIKRHIRKNVEKHTPNVNTTRAFQQQLAVDEVSDPEEDPSKNQLPQWKPDASSKECEDCKKPFTLLRRKHHCRACGGVFCASCTTKRIILPGGKDLVRVCDTCFQRLQDRI